MAQNWLFHEGLVAAKTFLKTLTQNPTVRRANAGAAVEVGAHDRAVDLCFTSRRPNRPPTK